MSRRSSAAILPGVYRRAKCWQVRIRRQGHVVGKSFPFDPADNAGPRSAAAALLKANAFAAQERAALRFEKRQTVDLLETQTLGGWCDRYERETMPTKRGAKQERDALRRIRAGFPDILARPVSELGPLDFSTKSPASMWARMVAGGYDPQTAARRYTLLAAVFKAAVAPEPDGFGFTTYKSPLAGISWPRQFPERARERVITPTEWGAIWKRLTTSAEPPAKAAIGFLRWTGARRGEVQRLDWSRLDFATDPPIATFTPETTKTGRGRKVPLAPGALLALRLLKPKGKPWPEAGPVFRIAPESVSRAFRVACQRAGVAGARLHDLRHTRLTEITRVLPLQDAMLVSGHTQPQTLMRYYHHRAEDIGKALAKAEKRQK